ncbi:MAG: acyl-CoA dehydrogenase, partial [Gemmatimonadota bacterium]
FGLFGGSVFQLGTREHHERYLRDIGTLALPGCYAMTETAHGSNVRDLETTATWDPATGELVIRTPREEAGKDWIGNAALHGRMATVFARLVVRGEDHGVHALLAPIRDERGAVLPGVRVEDRGLKEGLNGVDNGRIWFDGVRVPRENLLDRFASLDASGSYHSPIASPGRRFFTMLGTLVTGRVSIACASVSAAKTGLAIAVRYADRRVQFGPEGEGEVPILDYLVVQRALLPRLAETYGLHFAIRDLQGRVGGPSAEPDPVLEVRAAGLKAEASRHCVETLQACREACGGRGYLAANRFAALKADTDVFTTFEGANGVLLQLVAKGLLSRYRHEMGDLRFWDMVRFVAERAGESVRTLNPIVTRRTDEEHLRDPAFHASSFRYREERLLRSVALRLKRRVDDGMDTFRAINSCQDHLVELATAHVEVLVLEALQDGAARAPSPGLSEALSTLSALYALWRMETHRGWYLEAGYVEGGKSRAIRGQVNALCREVREYAGLLVDAFGIPERVLAAPAAGVQDGHEGNASAVH